MVTPTSHERPPYALPRELTPCDLDVLVPRLDVPIPQINSTSTLRVNSPQGHAPVSDGLLGLSELEARGVAVPPEERESAGWHPGELHTWTGVPPHSVE